MHLVILNPLREYAAGADYKSPVELRDAVALLLNDMDDAHADLHECRAQRDVDNACIRRLTLLAEAADAPKEEEVQEAMGELSRTGTLSTTQAHAIYRHVVALRAALSAATERAEAAERERDEWKFAAEVTNGAMQCRDSVLSDRLVEAVELVEDTLDAYWDTKVAPFTESEYNGYLRRFKALKEAVGGN